MATAVYNHPELTPVSAWLAYTCKEVPCNFNRIIWGIFFLKVHLPE